MSTKLKLLDNCFLRSELNDLYDMASKLELCHYAIELCLRILSKIEYEDNVVNVIQEGISINQLWQIDQVRMHDVRTICFKIHALAREHHNPIQQLGLRVIGHALATAHMQEHALVASDYAIKLVNAKFRNDSSEVTLERLWQIDSLKNIIDSK